MNELEWLTDDRPDVAATRRRDDRPRPRRAAGPRGRRATRVGAASAGGASAPRRGPRARRAVAAPRKAPLYALAAAVFAVAIVVVAGALPSGDGRPAVARIVGGPAPAEAALVKLSQRIQAAPTPTGDATLVLRSHHFPDGEGLHRRRPLPRRRPLLLRHHARRARGTNTNDLGEGVPKLEREAAKAAITLPSDQARRSDDRRDVRAAGRARTGQPARQGRRGRAQREAQAHDRADPDARARS